jgi:hypothetical protein
MKNNSKIFITLVLVLLSPNLLAEIYRDIGYFDTLGDVKAKFPNASFENVKPAWAQEKDALYKISGTGISGMIVVKFTDGRPLFKKILIDEGPSLDETRKAYYEGKLNQQDNDALMVSWVRWVPSTPIPLERFIAKYGKPTEKGFADEDMQPLRGWPQKGVTASLTDNEKSVVKVDYTFTEEEMRVAYKNKTGFIPEWLKEKKSIKYKK